MQQTLGARTPVHVWIVRGLATLWNGFGCYDYLMTRLRDEDYIAGMMPGTDPDALLAWVDAFPLYAQAAWGPGVWAGLAGSLLLLARNRFAVHAFALSLIGAVVGMIYQGTMAPPMPGPENAMTEVMPYVIIAISGLLFWYARSAAKKGLLR